MSLKCDVCGDPAMTSVLKDPFGKSDQTSSFCAVHAPTFSALRTLTPGTKPTVSSNSCSECSRLREALERIDAHLEVRPDSELGHLHVISNSHSLGFWLALKAAREVLRSKPSGNETPPVALSEVLRAEAATVKLGECMPAGRFPEGVSRYNALMWAAELIEERSSLKAKLGDSFPEKTDV